MKNPQIIIFSTSFYASRKRVDNVTWMKAEDAVEKFMEAGHQKSSKGLHFEPLHGTADKTLYSIRIDQGNRIILSWKKEENKYIFLYVGTHENAYAWAENRKASVNDEVGAIQLYVVNTIDQRMTQPARPGLFQEYSDRYLKSIGVPEEQLSLVRVIRDEKQLQELLVMFPEAVAEYLEALAIGAATPAEILEQVQANKDASGGDAMMNPDTLRTFVTAHMDPELKRILTEGDLEEWRIFLHPDQRWLVQRRFAGPALALGGAGTGKTVTALHRARALAARMLEERVEGKLLFTFYTGNLIEDISNRLRSICTPEEFKRIHVLNIDKVFTQLRELPGYEQVKILYPSDRELAQLWEAAAAIGDPEQRWPPNFYWDEWNEVITERDVPTLEDYLKVSRIGRGKPLFPEQREQVWQVFEAYRQLMKERQLMDNRTAIDQYRRYVSSCPEAPYRHVIVDETQDFSSGALRLVRALAGPEHEDDLFLVGDTRQRIYNRPTSLASCGIQVQGRVKRLQLNYRTTYQIQRAAVHLLEGETFDDLNGGTDDGSGYRSCTSGANPQVGFFGSEEAELQWILSELKKLTEGGVPPADICLTVSTNQQARMYIKALNSSGVRTFELKQRDDRGMDGIRVGTMHRIKGLEFKYMFIAGVNRDDFLPRSAGTYRERMKQASCMMYVALTRAQTGAYVSGYGKTPPMFLVELEKMAQA